MKAPASPTAQHTLTDIANLCPQIRRDILRMTHGAQSGHPGGSLGCVELLVALYFHTLRTHREFSPSGAQEDIFLLSNGHISPVWYAVLARAGYFPVAELATFRKLNSRLQGHPATHHGLPGIRVASGSLGQGLSVAIGMAEAKKLDQDPHLVHVLMGDGEAQEGQVWEAAMYAAHHRVDNLIAIMDCNGKQIDGPTNEVLSLGNLRAKWEAFGWHVVEGNGNHLPSVIDSLQQARQATGNQQPVIYLMRTQMGYGVDFMVGTHHWHGVAPNTDQLTRALAQLEETLGDY